MYGTFEVRNFRCFDEFRIDGLDRVNLIAGKNNVGKTALLEALSLHCDLWNATSVTSLFAFRGITRLKLGLANGGDTVWDALFHDFDLSKTIEIVGADPDGDRRTLRLRVLREPSERAKAASFLQDVQDLASGAAASVDATRFLELSYQDGPTDEYAWYMFLDPQGVRIVQPPVPAPCPAVFQAARHQESLEVEAGRFGQLEINNQVDVLLAALRIVEPRLRRLAMVVLGGEPILHADVAMDRLVPLPFMGEGMTRLASLLLSIGSAQDGVVLIDEVENGLHHSLLTQVWRAIGEAARQFNTQVFATTHSLECIAAAQKAFADGALFEPDFRLYRLDRLDGTIHAVAYAPRTLAAALENDLEVR